jgi:hypothetical protein
MKREILITLLCAGIILITPLTSVAQENKISNNPSEQPDIDGLVSQLRIIIDEILEKYGHIPIVANLCNMIFNSFSFIGNYLICITILILLIPLAILFLIVDSLGLNIAWWVVFLVSFELVSLYLLLCPPSITIPFINLETPFKSLSTLTETKDITNLIEDCPCIQE